LEIYSRLESLSQHGILELLPQTDAIPETIANCHCVLLPSTYNEGIPRSLLEALSIGRPVITTNWPGCRETVEDGKNGFLISPRDPMALVAGLLKFQSLESQQIAEFGKRSREIAVERFDEKYVLKAYLDALDFPEGLRSGLT
jgi:glycosyltransferase involved in cell wall biosynthesis